MCQEGYISSNVIDMNKKEISMSKSREKKEKRGRSVLARYVVICIAATIIGSLAIPIQGLAAQQTEDNITVTVNAPECVKEGESFNVAIDMDNIADFNSGQFDLSFDSSVVSVTGVADGRLDGATIPVFMWRFMDKDRIRVILMISGAKGVSGSGYLAKINFEVVGNRGDRSVLDISNGLLVNNKAEEIPAAWIDDEVIIGLFDPWRYDINENGTIEKREVIEAIRDYFDDVITKVQVIEVIRLYFR